MRDQIDTFIKDTLRIDDAYALVEYFVDFFAGYSIDLFTYTYLAEGFKRLPLDRVFRISRLPTSFIERYLRENYFDIDPVMEEARRRAVPFHWYDAEASPGLTAKQKRYFTEMRAAGFLDGLAVPIYARPGDIAYFGLGSTKRELDFTRAQELEIQAICQHMHLRYNELTESPKPPKLSKREIQVLELIARGKSNAQMSEMLGVSRNTIDTLVRRCFDKLGVTSRVEAALAGVALGIILP